MHADHRDQQADEIKAALSAVKALVDDLGPFLSPYLTDLLILLLRPETMGLQDAAAEAGRAIRSRLPLAIPTRLLLPALLSQLAPALKAGLLPIAGFRTPGPHHNRLLERSRLWLKR